jgi:anti-sigma factor RsiW
MGASAFAEAGAGAGARADPRASLERRGSRAGARRRLALPWATGLGGALLASVCTLAVVSPGSLGWHRGEAMATLQTAEASEAVSAHTRSLLVDHPIEVASSDQHTVRPWLSARLNFVPPVTDFAPQGYPLVGARRDVLSGETAAALVYRHGAHVISVFVRPVDPSATRAAEATRVVRGFNVIERNQGGLAFCFVSDANPHELAALADLVAPLSGT